MLQLIDLDPMKRPALEEVVSHELFMCTRWCAELSIGASVHDYHVKPSMCLFPKYFSIMHVSQARVTYSHTVSSSYYLSSIAHDDADSVMQLANTLSSLTINELPLILPLLQHLQHNILANPSQTLLSTLFISIWNRVAASLHQQQVASLLLEVLTTLLEQSLQLHNYQPLLVLLQRKELKAAYRSIGPKQVLKVLLPLLLEQLYLHVQWFMTRLNTQTPEKVAAAICNSLAYLASPSLLGATLTTRYILPTLTLKTGSVTFKRTEFMKRWGEGGPPYSN